MTEISGRANEVDGSPVVPRRIRWPEDNELVLRFFSEYREWVADHRDPAPSSRARVQQGLALIDRLIADLPRTYRPPHGDILLWSKGEHVVACGALRELEPGVGEIRRIYVRADYRGGKFGHPFVRALIVRARELGFGTVRADTLSTMHGAIEFYEELGFRRVAAYWPHPASGALFFERAVEPRGTTGRTADRPKSR
jgi:putative acetyltransferase